MTAARFLQINREKKMLTEHKVPCNCIELHKCCSRWESTYVLSTSWLTLRPNLIRFKFILLQFAVFRRPCKGDLQIHQRTTLEETFGVRGHRAADGTLSALFEVSVGAFEAFNHTQRTEGVTTWQEYSGFHLGFDADGTL